MWLIHIVGKYRKHHNRTLWISFLSTQTASSICLLNSERTARTQFWELAFFSSGWNIECLIFQCHTIYHTHILVISFHTVWFWGWLARSFFVPIFLHSLSHLFLTRLFHEVLLAYICKIRTSYSQSFERYLIQSYVKKSCRFHLHGWNQVWFLLWFTLSCVSGSDLKIFKVYL